MHSELKAYAVLVAFTLLGELGPFRGAYSSVEDEVAASHSLQEVLDFPTVSYYDSLVGEPLTGGHHRGIVDMFSGSSTECFNGGVPPTNGDSNCTCPARSKFSGLKCEMCQTDGSCDSIAGPQSVCERRLAIWGSNKQFECSFNTPFFIKQMGGGRDVEALVTLNCSTPDGTAFHESNSGTCEMTLFRVEPKHEYVDPFFSCSVEQCTMHLEEIKTNKANKTPTNSNIISKAGLIAWRVLIVALCLLLAMLQCVSPKVGRGRTAKLLYVLACLLVAVTLLFILVMVLNMHQGTPELNAVYECNKTHCDCSEDPPKEYGPFCSGTVMKKFILPQIKNSIKIVCNLQDKTCRLTLKDVKIIIDLNCTASECTNKRKFPNGPSLPVPADDKAQRALLTFIALGFFVLLVLFGLHVLWVLRRTQKRNAEFVDRFGLPELWTQEGGEGVPETRCNGQGWEVATQRQRRHEGGAGGLTAARSAMSIGEAGGSAQRSCSGDMPSLSESERHFTSNTNRHDKKDFIRGVTKSPLKLQLTDLDYKLESSCFSSNNNDASQHILQQVNFSVKSGDVLAIIGPSGAGKTSLLDLLSARRKQGRVFGEMTINNTPLVGASNEVTEQYRNIIGYVSQEDTLIPALTVYETIKYAARLKLPQAFSSESINGIVDRMIEALRLTRCKDTVIGDGTKLRGVSGGEKRRVSIAVELLANPRILFLDEPTSGLDAVSAKHVIDAVVQLAKESPMRAYAPHYFAFRPIVIFSIHQPSQEIYELCDKILLLSRGMSIYCGPASCAAETLEARVQRVMGGVQTIPRLADNPNHAEYLMKLEEIVDDVARVELQRENTAQMLSRDETSSGMRHEEQAIIRGDIILKTTFGFRRYYANVYQQVGLLTSRAARSLLTSSHLIVCHAAVTASVSTLMMILYHEEGLDLPGALNRAGSVTFLLLVVSFASLSCLEHLVTERKLFAVERENGYYTTLPYLLSKIIVDIIPLRVLPTLVMAALIYVPMGLRGDSGIHLFWFIIIVALFSVCITLIVMCVGVVTGSFGSAALLSSVVILWNFVFGGLLVQSTTVPAALRPFQAASPFFLAFESLLVNELDGQDCTFAPTDATGKPSSTNVPILCVQYLTNMGLTPARFTRDVGQLAVMVLVLLCLAWLLLFQFTTVAR